MSGSPPPTARSAAWLLKLSRQHASRRFGCTILDVRPRRIAFWGHLPGSAGLPIDDPEHIDEALPRHMLPPRGESITVIAQNAAIAREAARNLKRRGYPSGYLDGPIPPDALVPGPPPGALWKPEPFLQTHLGKLPHPDAGRVLDLGAGSGRDSVFLAARGYHCVLADRLADALELARDRAWRHGVEVRCELGDLRAPEALPEGPFAAVLNIRFLERPLLERLHEVVQPEGVLVLWTYARSPQDPEPVGAPSAAAGLGDGADEDRPGPRRERYRLDPAEIRELLPGEYWEFACGPLGRSREGERWAGAVARRR